MTAAVNIAQSGTNNVTMRNRIINGGMMIDQRNAGASVLNTAASGVYFLDRFYYNASIASKLTFQQSTSAPAGFANSLSVTVTNAATIGAGDYFTINQPIEANNVSDFDFGLSTAKTFTVSFWVKSSITGTFCGDIRNSAATRDYVFTYTINSANTWEQKSVTITGDVTGTWNRSGTSTGISLRIDLGSGSSGFGTANTWNAGNVWSVSGSASSTFAAQAGATFYITGVQLEKGTVATPFEQRLYGTEFALCQRYYQIASSIVGSANSAVQVAAIAPFQIPMRAAPTLGVQGVIQLSDGTADYTQSSAAISALASTANCAIFFLTNFTGLTTNRVAFGPRMLSNSNSVTLSAEL